MNSISMEDFGGLFGVDDNVNVITGEVLSPSNIREGLHKGVDLSMMDKKKQRIIRTREAACSYRKEQKMKLRKLLVETRLIEEEKDLLMRENEEISRQIVELRKLNEGGPVDDQVVKDIVKKRALL